MYTEYDQVCKLNIQTDEHNTDTKIKTKVLHFIQIYSSYILHVNMH